MHRYAMFPADLRSILVGLAFISCWSAPASAQDRYALIIGNADYENAPDLRNPHNDAEDLAARLEAIGYELVGGGARRDLSRRQMLEALDDLSNDVSEDDVVLVFFAGHGSFFGDGASAETYLIPSNDRLIRYREDLPDRAVALSSVVRRINALNAAGVVVVDACRNLPLPSRVGGRDLGRGLAPPPPASSSAGLLIAYAADVGQIALDGEERNSPFTTALLEALETPWRRVDDVFGDVRRSVREATNGAQTPLVQSYLEAPLVLAPNEQVALQARMRAAEIAFKAIAPDDACAYASFARIFPESSFAAVAQIRGVDCGGDQERSPQELDLGIDADGFDRETRTLLNSCEARDSLGCLSLAIHFREGTGGAPRDLATAAALFEVGCELGDFRACTVLGHQYNNGQGVTEDPERAAELYRQVCIEGDRQVCYLLGVFYSTGRGVEVDFVEAANLWARACAGGVAPGCAHLAYAYAVGDGVEADLPRAAHYYELACGGGHGDSCTDLGMMYGNGRGVQRNVPRAAQLFEQACEAGSGPGCTNRGVLYQSSPGADQRDLYRAIVYYRRGCNAGHARGCDLLAEADRR